MLAFKTLRSAGPSFQECQMSRKAIAGFVIVALAAVLIVGLRTVNRADAAAEDCYSGDQGPSTPVICG